ncbi:TIGR00730 family Rossman fold protein [Thermophagus sp. OGC60D27]|uniref:LOG family protein n=1 Tax=Thermophagus sp. OGC60D27 TaxID=3458415 RepID=UPI0040377802
MNQKKNIAVFCASSPLVPRKYFDAATKASSALINAGYGIIYGGGSNGLMGAVADEALKHNAPVTGVIPRFMVEVEWQHKKVDDMVLVDTMHQRKELMVKNSSGILALPGGIGTLEELFEVLSLKKLGQYPHPVIILNTDGYFDGLTQLFHKMTDESFMRPIHQEMWSMVQSPDEIVPALKNSKPWGKDAISFAAL